MTARKAMTGVRVMDADQGVVEAVFSTFGVEDSDGDVTLPGAFEDGAEVPISAYGHSSWGGALPVGKGTLTQTDTEAIVTAQFFMDTQLGADTFRTVKALGELGQWSYGYDPTRWSMGEHGGNRVRFLEQLKVHEVSPVLVGAGVGTRTLSAKSADGLTLHEQATEALAALEALLERTKALAALRAQDGRAIGTATRDQLGEVLKAARRSAADLDAILVPAIDPKAQAIAAAELVRAVRLGHMTTTSREG